MSIFTFQLVRAIILFFLLLQILNGAFERTPFTASSYGTGFSLFLPEPTPFAIIQNPAAFGNKRLEAEIFSSSPFQLPEIKEKGFAVTIPFSKFSTAASVYSFGFSLYSESTISLGIYKSFQRDFSLGLTGHFHQLQIKNYGSMNTATLSAAANFKVTDEIRWGILYRQVGVPFSKSDREIIPQILATGISIQPSQHITAVIEVEDAIDFEERFKMGVEWRPLPFITATAGFITSPEQITTSLTIGKKWITISYAYSTHPELQGSFVVSLLLSRL